jgi:hypothetical protein
VLQVKYRVLYTENQKPQLHTSGSPVPAGSRHHCPSRETEQRITTTTEYALSLLRLFHLRTGGNLILPNNIGNARNAKERAKTILTPNHRKRESCRETAAGFIR